MARTITLACVSILLVAAIIRQPNETFQASLQGLTLWWTIIFPGLMPFLVLSELMAIFGVTALAGRLMQPAMERLFRLPGDAGIAVAAGWTGGYAAGSEAAAKLHRSGQLTRPQGQRLLALAHMPNPLFMLIVVGAGFMHQPSAGIAIAIAVWVGGLIAAFASSIGEHLSIKRAASRTGTARQIIRKRASSTTDSTDQSGTAGTDAPTKPAGAGHIFRRAEEARRSTYASDGRSFGQALGDSTIAAVQKLLTAGGIIIVSAVLVRLVEPIWDAVDGLLHLPHWLLPALLESHLGAYAASTWPIHSASAVWPAAAAAAALAWSGLGAIAQTSAAIAGTDLKLMPFLVNRALHALLAAAAAMLLWRPVSSLFSAAGDAGVLPALLSDARLPAAAIRTAGTPTLWPFVPALFISFLLLIAVFALLSAALRVAASRR